MSDKVQTDDWLTSDGGVQVSGVDQKLLEQVEKQVRPGTVVEGGPGYFKIARRHSLKPGMEAAAGAHQCAEDSALVVAFGSAPGVPNWGGLLKRVELAGAADPDWQSFDVLFVVDGSRSWYDGMVRSLIGSHNGHVQQSSTVKHPAYFAGGDDGVAVYKERLERVCKSYKTVVMLGDSMGATAALLFAPLATSVLAFCPQVRREDCRSTIRRLETCTRAAVPRVGQQLMSVTEQVDTAAPQQNPSARRWT